MGIVSLLALLLIIPCMMVLIGVVELFSSNPATRKRATKLLVGGILLLLVEILIGNSICSNVRMGGMH